MSWKPATAMLSFLTAIVLLTVGCADVPSTGPAVPDFKADFRFINAATDAGSLNITVDNGHGASAVTISGLEVGGASEHMTFNAGNRETTLSTGDVATLSMDSEKRGSILILNAINGTRRFVKLAERRRFDPARTEVTDSTGTTPITAFRLVNGMDDGTVVYAVLAGTDTLQTGNVTFSPTVDTYTDQAAPGSYTVTVYNADDDSELASATATFEANRFTAIVYGTAASASAIVLDDEK
ncbi:MAG TPA: hypothetical protein ENJ29_01815 [Bacteroidetes bacterium]|nr:hypothetical protein [Bacteroidota bacterium]